MTAAHIIAQQETIPERLARAGQSLTNFTTTPSGIPPRVQQILARTDLIVIGTLAEPGTYLSDDEMEVYTDYRVLQPVVLFGPDMARVPAPGSGRDLMVTFLGGKITIGELTFSSEHDALPLPAQGTECLLLLKRIDGRYFVAGKYFGIFLSADDRLTPLVRKPGFASEYAGVRPWQAADDMARIARALHKR